MANKIKIGMEVNVSTEYNWICLNCNHENNILVRDGLIKEYLNCRLCLTTLGSIGNMWKIVPVNKLTEKEIEEFNNSNFIETS
ncbi:MAG: hypothetical protein A2W23_06350 [Planctomycetes bacterium RBG_16_43_13]|nr:MAG: hypothetical protein A2W23_06350 [Planctomycetes bacterium RBG_16_43_13]